MEFVRFDKTPGTIRLRLHNYTAWDIRVPVEMSSIETVKMARTHEDGAKADVRYSLQEFEFGPRVQMTMSSGKKLPPDEPEHPPVPKFQRIDLFTEWWIPRDQNILFDVPKQHLARNIMLYVPFRYDWETLGTENLDGPVHLVYFRGIDLPQNVQDHIK